MKVVVKIDALFEADEVWSRVWGAAPESFPWYRQVRFEGSASWESHGAVTVVVDDPNSADGGALTKVLHVTDLCRAITSTPGVQGDFMNDDLDATSADVIVQVAIFGEVVFA